MTYIHISLTLTDELTFTTTFLLVVWSPSSFINLDSVPHPPDGTIHRGKLITVACWCPSFGTELPPITDSSLAWSKVNVHCFHCWSCYSRTSNTFRLSMGPLEPLAKWPLAICFFLGGRGHWGSEMSPFASKNTGFSHNHAWSWLQPTDESWADPPFGKRANKQASGQRRWAQKQTSPPLRRTFIGGRQNPICFSPGHVGRIIMSLCRSNRGVLTPVIQ